MLADLHRRAPLLLATILAMSGCTDDPDVSSPSDSPENDSAESSELPELVFFTQNYSVSAGDYDEAKTHDDPDAEFVKQLFAKTTWDDPDVRPIFKLVRPGDKVNFIQVRRNQSVAGEFHVAWCGLADGQPRQGESTEVDSSEKLLEMLLAYLDRDPELVNLIEWDELE
ncbi:MAG: hypothetical protein CMJ48_01720 [Planctomycetaceae bacterium]|nr:hypothetical protein [Planctomycetaceae bacterium]